MRPRIKSLLTTIAAGFLVATACGGSPVTPSTPPVTPSPPLVAAFTAPTQNYSERAVTFNATSSTGPITGYQWDFGDGGRGSGPVVTHTYPCSGKPAASNEQTFTVTLTVSDSGGRTNAVSKPLMVAYSYRGVLCAHP